MASRDLEGPLLGIKTFKCKPTNWLAQGLGDTSRVLTICMKEKSPYWPSNVMYTLQKSFSDGEILLNEPDASYDAVYLTGVIEHYDRQQQLELLGEAARVTRNGGRVVAYSPACDDAEEAFELAKKYGLDTTKFKSGRLSNKDIVRLKPHNAAFFQDLTVLPNSTRLVKVLNELGLDATLEHMWGIKSFAIRRFHVGMSWQIGRG